MNKENSDKTDCGQKASRPENEISRRKFIQTTAIIGGSLIASPFIIKSIIGSSEVAEEGGSMNTSPLISNRKQNKNMKVIAINGSPRPRGNTSQALKIVLAEIEAAGIQT